MTRALGADEARALFDRALDGELDAATRAAFDAALARDAALREEYERAGALTRATAALANPVGSVDLLAGVQQKLRARSGGRFYRDKFAEQRGRTNALTWMLLASSVLLIVVVLWFALDVLR